MSGWCDDDWGASGDTKTGEEKETSDTTRSNGNDWDSRDNNSSWEVGRGRGRGRGRGGSNRGGYGKRDSYENSTSGGDWLSSSDNKGSKMNSDSSFGGGSWGDNAPSNGRGNQSQDGEEGERPAPYKPKELNLDEEALLQADIGENFKRYKEQTVTCVPQHIKPIDKLEDAIESELLLKNVTSLRYAELTPIQKWAIPAIMKGYDLIGCAQTGSGKTAAFLLPVLQTIMKTSLETHDPNNDCQNPYCLIISPTRELAKQIYVQAGLLSKDSVVRCCYIYGQIATAHLKAQLSRGCHILVATLGRLKDFVERGWIGFKNVKYIILDEGDRLVDDGFTGDLKAILEHESMPPKEDRQTLFFSATFKNKVQHTARAYLKPNQIFITVGRVGAANEDIKQEFLHVSRADKKRELRAILKEVPPSDKTIIFTQTKNAADMLAGFFNSLKLSATSIHGDRHQSQREEAINVFKRGDKRFLISSPVGNRGLDLPKVSLVINYDLPDSIDEYVHRIGRTGRAGNTGRAISFVDQERDQEVLPDLIKILKEANQEIPSWLESCIDTTAPTDSVGSGEDWAPSSDTSTNDARKSKPSAEKSDFEDEWGTSASNSTNEKNSTKTVSSPLNNSNVEEDWGSSGASAVKSATSTSDSQCDGWESTSASIDVKRPAPRSTPKRQDSSFHHVSTRHVFSSDKNKIPESSRKNPSPEFEDDWGNSSSSNKRQADNEAGNKPKKHDNSATPASSDFDSSGW